MATITKTELCKDAMRHLGILDPNEDPSEAEQSLAERRFDSILSELSVYGLDESISELAVPEWAQVPMIHLVAFEIAPSFGRDQSPVLRIEALARLRRQQSLAEAEDLNLPIYRPTHL